MIVRNRLNPMKEIDIDERYKKFVDKIEEFCRLDYYQLQQLSFMDNYRYMFNIFNNCRIHYRETLCVMCLNYLKKKCEGINYNRMSRIYDILMYFSRIHIPTKVYLDEKLKDIRIRNRTLMELCLLKIDESKELKKQLNSTVRHDIESRIKKYYFD